VGGWPTPKTLRSEEKKKRVLDRYANREGRPPSQETNHAEGQKRIRSSVGAALAREQGKRGENEHAVVNAVGFSGQNRGKEETIMPSIGTKKGTLTRPEGQEAAKEGEEADRG